MWPGTGSKFHQKSSIKGLVIPSFFLSSKNHLSQASMVSVMWDMHQISARTTGPVMHDGPIDQNGTVSLMKKWMEYELRWHSILFYFYFIQCHFANAMKGPIKAGTLRLFMSRWLTQFIWSTLVWFSQAWLTADHPIWFFSLIKSDKSWKNNT